MGVIESALKWIQDIADDDSHGYDQSNRWGPDFDCSSLVITAFKKAGLALSCTYTGNMASDMIQKGFRDVTSSVNLSTGHGLTPGDVLLNHANHTAMYIGYGTIVQASSNESGGVTGGKTGDQTGREISRRSYYNFPWDAVLRYEEHNDSDPTEGSAITSNDGSYVVKAGDSLWSIAEKVLGDGCRYGDIIKLNNLVSDHILIGQILKIPTDNAEQTTVDMNNSTAVRFVQVDIPELSKGSSGMTVRCLQSILRTRGCSVSETGDFDSITIDAVSTFQRSAGLDPDGIVGSATWRSLLNE